ncbi:phage tail protein [Escherichia coli]|uniref:phage tail fiber protein n=1 Tax=Escherichia coli TaxID=562 RepID=UPI00225AD03C|nr:phage tail protein [Escherichia coli]MCX3791150.1 phage tail protein [Escherichia coli]
MIYTTGTIAISGNNVTGTGTNFTAAGSLIRNGCTVIAMTSPVQVFQITAIVSATSLTVTPAASPAIPAGTKYSILLSDSLSVDGLAQDIAETFTMYQRYMSGFADVMNGTSDVTITINGTAVTVPGQKSLAKKGANSDITSLSGLTTALGISQGGTGAKNAADARSNLNLGSSATLNAGNAAGNVITRGSGISASYSDVNLVNFMKSIGSGWYRNLLAGIGMYQYSAGFYSYTGDTHAYIQVDYATGNVRALGTGDNLLADGIVKINTLYGTVNTTKSSDGTLKAASPVARIVTSRDVCQRADIAEDGFSWCGCGTVNAEAEGITLSRLDVGIYMLTGSAGLASDGWQLLPPMDPGGMGELGVVEAELTDNGELTIRLFKRKYMLSDEGEIVKTKGEPIDVPANSWIDVRLDMPESSIWNQRQKAAMEAAENESGS